MLTYEEYIQNIIKERGQWNIPEGEYFEGHHIIPVCKGGTGNIYKGKKCKKDTNIIHLYAQEHYIAHKLLALENPDDKQLVSAWLMMAFPKGKTRRESIEITPDEYAHMRKLWAEIISRDNPGLNAEGHPWNYGLTAKTDERVRQYSEKSRISKTGVPTGPKSETTRQNMSIAQRKRALERPETYINHNRGKVCITNNHITIFVDKNEPLPQGFEYGNCYTRGHHDMSNYYSNEEMQKHRSDITSGKNNGMYGKGYKVSEERNGRYGKPTSENTRKLISEKLTGKRYSEEVNKSKGRPGMKKPEGFAEKCKRNTAKYIYYIDGNEFYGQTDLSFYIKSTYGYSISSSGIDSVINNRPRAHILFPDLIGKITSKENLHENNKDN